MLPPVFLWLLLDVKRIEVRVVGPLAVGPFRRSSPQPSAPISAPRFSNGFGPAALVSWSLEDVLLALFAHCFGPEIVFPVLEQRNQRIVAQTVRITRIVVVANSPLPIPIELQRTSAVRPPASRPHAGRSAQNKSLCHSLNRRNGRSAALGKVNGNQNVHDVIMVSLAFFVRGVYRWGA